MTFLNKVVDDVGPIIEAIRQRILSRSQARAGAFLPRTRPQPLKITQSTDRTDKVPLFGSDSGFGEDWSFSRSFAPAPQGVVRAGVPKMTVNRGGSTSDLKPARIMGPSEVQETRRGKPSYAGTDQKVSKHGSIVNWDGLVRNLGKRAGFERSRRPKELTEGDRIAVEMRSEPYDFF